MQTFRPRTIRLAGLLGLSAFGAMFCWGCGRGAPAPQQAPGIGGPAGRTPLATPQRRRPAGEPGRPAGSVVLLSFWGTWCPPCLRELPHIATIYKNHQADADFQLLAVSCGGPGENETIDALRTATAARLKKMQITIPTYADLDEVTRTAAGVEGYPTTLVLDRQGIVRGIWTSYDPGYGTEMEELIGRLLKEKATEPRA